MDRGADVCLGQSQPSASTRFRTLRHNGCRVRPPRNDPHYASAPCCRKPRAMNPNFPDGLLAPDWARQRLDMATKTEIPALTGLRGVAVLAVIVGHYSL